MAGLSLAVTKIFYVLYLIGGVSFGLVFFLQFFIMFLVVLNRSISKRVRALIASVLYLTAFFDVLHVFYYGIDNTAFNPPVIASLVYSILIIASFLLYIGNFTSNGKTTTTLLTKITLYLIVIPDVLAFLLLFGPWLTELTRASYFGLINVASATALPYSLLAVGIIVILYSLVRRVNYVYPLIGLIISIPVVIIVWFHIIPAIGLILGFTFPYILGIMGVTDWFPPIFFLVALTAFLSTIGLLRRGEKYIAIPILALMGSALIFDTIPSTTYMLMPLIAVLLSSFYS